jgi:hypothetical protein
MDYSIEHVEAKVYELKQKSLSLLFQLGERQEEYKNLPADQKEAHDTETRKIEEEQRFVEKQFKSFSNILASMKKVEKAQEKGGLGMLLADIHNIKSSVADIQQKITRD